MHGNRREECRDQVRRDRVRDQGQRGMAQAARGRVRRRVEGAGRDREALRRRELEHWRRNPCRGYSAGAARRDGRHWRGDLPLPQLEGDEHRGRVLTKRKTTPGHDLAGGRRTRGSDRRRCGVLPLARTAAKLTRTNWSGWMTKKPCAVHHAATNTNRKGETELRKGEKVMATKALADVTIQNEGSLFLFHAETERGMLRSRRGFVRAA